ncbi:MFS transporter [Bacillus rubiinfantis]|uniref:MFS transporter n=1 Tax=Bacillus rubiinfantis TaxID=1499680 RepID=UPI0005AA7F97|nr:MFS transporter [Bacillus rubiinfantis]
MAKALESDIRVTQEVQQGKIPYWVKVVIVFFLGWVALYATRTILNPIMGDIQNQFHLSSAQLGMIMSLFFLGYAALNVPSGIMGDKIGKKRVLVPGVILFGAFAAVTGLMPNFFFFMFSWLLVGIFQGFFYGPSYGLSSEAIPANRITLGSAIINSGMAFGTSLGYYISSYSVGVYGMSWRTPFFIIAVPVVLIGLAMWWVVKDKPKTKEQKAAENGGQKLKAKDLFNRNLIAAYVTIFCSIYGFFVVINWLPYYLEHERGITGGSVAFVASLVPWAAIPGSILFSWIADKMGRRKPVLLVMLPIAFIATISIVAFHSMTILYIALITYGIFGKISTNPVLVAVVADNAPKHAYSTSFGFYNFIGMCGSILSPYITGFLTDVTGSLNAGFYFAAALIFVGFISSMFIDEKHRRNVPATN